MVMVRLLISDGSWLVLLVAEKATLALPERTEMPREEVTAPSPDGLESHTTRHLPSSTMGSVSFWALTGQQAGSSSNNRASAAPKLKPKSAGSRSAPRRPAMLSGGPKGPRPGAGIWAGAPQGRQGRQEPEGCPGAHRNTQDRSSSLLWDGSQAQMIKAKWFSEGRHEWTCQGKESESLGGKVCVAGQVPGALHSLRDGHPHGPPELSPFQTWHNGSEKALAHKSAHPNRFRSLGFGAAILQDLVKGAGDF